jgi:hypothetical protein
MSLVATGQELVAIRERAGKGVEQIGLRDKMG